MSTLNPNQLDAEALYAALLADVKAGLEGVADVAIVGIHSGGAWIAERLAADLGLSARCGVLDVSFYRDDYAKKGLPAEVKPTNIGFDVAAANILLVDDVLYTGRTTRAAINELFDYGRPARIMLPRRAPVAGRRRFRRRACGRAARAGAGAQARRRWKIHANHRPRLI